MSIDISKLDLSGDLDMVFSIDEKGWAPRTDVYIQALVFAMDSEAQLPSPQAVYKALRLRGFPETKIDGVYGFKGIKPVYSDRVVQYHLHKKLPLPTSPWAIPQSERL